VIGRREFITLLSCVAAWPISAPAQQTGTMKRVGVLSNYSEGSAEGREYFAAFRRTLQDLGWTEGRNVEFMLRWTGGNRPLYTKYAVELTARSPDVV
jgi:putative ABC transport system substrate-binding protein